MDKMDKTILQEIAEAIVASRELAMRAVMLIMESIREGREATS